MKIERAREALKAHRAETLASLGAYLFMSARRTGKSSLAIAEITADLDALDELLSEESPRADAIIEAAIARLEGKR